MTFAQLAQQPAQLRCKEISIPEWGEGPWFLVEIDGRQHEEMAAETHKLFGTENPLIAAQKNAGHVAAIMLSRSLKDETGESPTQEWLLGQSIRLLNKLCTEAMELNGLSLEAQAVQEKN